MDHVIELPRTEVATRAATEMAAGPLQMAMNGLKAGMSIADARALLDLQKDWEANEARKAYALAMSGFKAEPMTIYKSKAVGYYTKATPEKESVFVGYKHAVLSDVTSEICPAMSRHQLSHRWDVRQDANFITVTCRITHALGHSESIEMVGAPDGTGNKNRLQQIASTVSYLQRYTLLAITGMATSAEDEDDDDGRGGEAGNTADAGDSEKTPPPPPDGPEFYAQDKFNSNFPVWSALIQTGKRTADEIIATVSSKGVMSPQQLAAVRACKTV